MKLYYYEASNPRKACAVAKYLGLEPEYVRVDLQAGEQRRPAYLVINPNGKVPALVDGEVGVWESTAIMMYLSARAGAQLWPDSTAGQATVLQWLAWDNAHFTRYAGELFFEHVIKPRFGIGEPDPVVVAETLASWRPFARVLDRHLARCRFVAGDELSIADFSLAGQISLPGDAGIAPYIPPGEFPQIERWVVTMAGIPAWREPWPSQWLTVAQADA
jgi:glutathione S-transferase